MRFLHLRAAIGSVNACCNTRANKYFLRFIKHIYEFPRNINFGLSLAAVFLPLSYKIDKITMIVQTKMAATSTCMHLSPSKVLVRLAHHVAMADLGASFLRIMRMGFLGMSGDRNHGSGYTSSALGFVWMRTDRVDLTGTVTMIGSPYAGLLLGVEVKGLHFNRGDSSWVAFVAPMMVCMDGGGRRSPRRSTLAISNGVR
ncbi:hypothetical protein, variant [Aphanomyces astaci]|nr:hypothetical protein, variant [Aphanomyces astaci]ETV71775.1 hypothetical protein, variant [Aphanomyces astaci]|eukprot:XP_009838624.1 hypothetical protein, variant [Aphanomyces astaci]